MEPAPASVHDVVAPLQLVAVEDAPNVHVRSRRSSYVRTQQLAAPHVGVALRAAFALLYAMLAMLAAHQLWGLGGSSTDALFNHWFNNIIFVGSGLAIAWRAASTSSERTAWSFVAAAVLTYCAGDLVWSMLYADSEAAVTWADALYLAFTPLLFVGIVLLVRSRIDRFELDRWIDGVAAALLVAAPGVVLVLEPTIRASEGTLLVKAVSVAYPLGDIVLLGSVVGVIALAGWQPGRSWIAFALGLACFVTADAFYAVENLNESYVLGGGYEFLWPAAGLLIATAAWLRPLRHLEVHAWGWRAIALPLLCQVAPIALLFLKDEPPSEQLLMSAVLAIVLVQLVVTRPRRPAHLG